MDEREARGWLCQAMRTIRERSQSVVEYERRLDALLADARAGGDVADNADRLRRDLKLPQPAAVRSFDQPAMVGIGGVGSGHPVPETFTCPAGQCPRTWTRQPGMTAPECHLYGGRLT